MTDLDRRVAKLMGWTWNAQRHHWADAQGRIMGWSNFSPSTNLLQAYKLWDEARPEGWRIQVGQAVDGMWYVEYESVVSMCDAKCKGFDDLPRAITQAWVEAKGGT